MLLYITKRKALETGLTHEGTLFGVPAWFLGGGTDEQDCFWATPKCALFLPWCWLGEKVLEFGAFFISSGVTIVAPITIKGPIK